MNKSKISGSTPIFSTNNEPEHQSLVVVGAKKKPRSDSRATKFMPAEPRHVYPYKPAKLIIPRPGSKKQIWIVRYSAWDKDLGELDQVDDTTIMDLPLHQRQAAGEALRDSINKKLESGAHFHESKRRQADRIKKVNDRMHLIPAADAFTLIVEGKKANKVKPLRKSAIDHYKNTVSRFKKWVAGTPYATYSANDLTTEHIQEYLQWEGEYGGRPDEEGNPAGASLKTIDGHRTDLSTFFTVLKVDPNPCDDVEYQPPPDAQVVIYTAEQKKTLIKHMQESGLTDVLLGCMFMYHCMCRTNEMANIRFEHIGLTRRNKIYLPQPFSKNKYERHIVIHPELMDILYELKSMYPPDWYLFSYGFKPGPKCCGSAKLGVYYRENVLEPCEFDWRIYKFYTWRGTANVDVLDTPGLPVSFAYEQGGWRTMSAYIKYCRALGREGREINIDQKPYLLSNGR